MGLPAGAAAGGGAAGGAFPPAPLLPPPPIPHLPPGNPFAQFMQGAPFPPPANLPLFLGAAALAEGAGAAGGSGGGASGSASGAAAGGLTVAALSLSP